MASSSRRRSGSSDSRASRRAPERTHSAPVARGGRSAGRSKPGASARSSATARSRNDRPKGRKRKDKNAPNQVQMSSISVGDLRAEARRQRNASEPSRRQARSAESPWVRRLIVAILILIALAVGGFCLYTSNLFDVEQVTVTGASHLTSEEVSQLAAVPQGSTLIRVDAGGIESRLESNAWVASAQVHRVFPHTLELRITERTIAAVVAVTSTDKQQTENWAIASDGTWLLNIPDRDSEDAQSISSQVFDDADNVLHITDVPYGVKPEVGAKCTDESVINALNIVSGLTTDLSGRVTTVSATDSANTTLTLDNGVQIAFGTGDDIRDKERVVLQLMQEHPDQIAYINVRVVDHPTWRAISS